MANTPAINHAFELAKRLNLEPSEREILERRERDALMYEKTLEWREEEAREEGERIGIEKMIIHMLERGNLTHAQIAAEVGLPLSEIERIDEARQAK